MREREKETGRGGRREGRKKEKKGKDGSDCHKRVL